MLKEFRDFALKGNVVDMAVGVIVGAAFGKIVSSFVTDIIMPPLGLAMGKVDFANLFVVLQDGKAPAPYASLAEAQAAGAVTVNYGVFANNIVALLIVSVVMFLMIQGLAKMKKKEEQAPTPEATTRDCPACFSKIDRRASRCACCTSVVSTA